MDGAIVLDKPAGISSHSAVVAVRRLVSERRIGHLGTLDPFACGVLVLLLGKATRLARFYSDHEKVYEGSIRFGFATDSYDSTGIATSSDQNPHLDAEEVRTLFATFTGTYLQQPPALSAKKIGGVPAYRLTRKGRPPLLAAVEVSVHELQVLSVEGALVRFRARVSSGTYIRSLAHEMGKRMGIGAHLATLRRTALGEFAEAQAVTFEELQRRVEEGTVPLVAAEALLPEFPALSLSEAGERAALHGNDVALKCSAEWVKLLNGSGKLIGMAERVADGMYHPTVVFNSEGETNPQSLASAKFIR